MAQNTLKFYSTLKGAAKTQLEQTLLVAIGGGRRLGEPKLGIVVANTEGQIIWLNESAGELLNLAAPQLVGTPVRRLYDAVFTQGHMPILELIDHLYADPYAPDQGTITTEVMLEVALCVIRARLAPMFAESNDFLGIMIMMQDVTQQAELERAKSEFVSNVSHELRRPLTAIKGYSDLLLFSGVGPLNAQQEHFLRIMQDNADRLVALANDLLDISHIESGRIQLDYSAIQMEKIVRDVVKAMQPVCDRRNVHLALQIDANIWPVWGDRTRLIQVTQNLITHAIQSTPEGGVVTVAVSCSDKAVRVDVTDTGAGIPPEEQGKLFQRFYRVNNPALVDPLGTGLGLPIAKQLVEMHGGGLLINSKMGAGSTFTFVLPRQDAVAMPRIEEVPEPPLHPTVLAVEDERDIAELIALQLRTEGFEVLTTPFGEQALLWAKERSIDLVTLDMMLPDITGMEVLRRLKADNATADIPVIVVSVIQPKMSGPGWGATEHISKPFALDKLMDTVRRTLTNARRGRLTPVTVVEPAVMGKTG